MKRNRRSKQIPILLLWSKREQARFIADIERLISIVGDLETFLAARKRASRPKAPQEPIRGNVL